MIWYDIYDIGCDVIRYDMIYLLTAIGLTPGGSSTIHIYTQTVQQYSTHLHTNSIQNNTMKQNTQNITYITIRIHKHNNKKYVINTIKQNHTKHTTIYT
jgi:hypothetical protein